MNVASPQTDRSKIHQHKLALWVAIGSMIMMFGSLTSAYVVRRAQGNWVEFKLPDVFFVSTAIILISSATIQMSFNAFRRGNEKMYKGMMLTTFVLGLLFIILQYQGWLAMNEIGITLNGNPSGSFVFVISGLHAAHLLGGITALTVALIHAFYLPFKPTPRRVLRFELVTQFWHFVDVLWVYLLVFFLLQS
ncbi:MAG: heme-copper oxidase subunit III [Saprospiraceae bacterium]